jgi:hypothetical protein
MGVSAIPQDRATAVVAAVPKAVWSLVPERLIRARVIFPVGLEGEPPKFWLLVATSTPSDLATADELAFVTGLRVKLVETDIASVRRLIALHLGERQEPAEPRAADVAPIELPPDDGPPLAPKDWLTALAPGDTKWR